MVSNDLNIKSDMTFIIVRYLPISANIVILGSVTGVPGFIPPPTAINHTQCCPITNADREWSHLSVIESGKLICSV